MNLDDLRDKCRTCAYLATSEYGHASGRCSICGKPVFYVGGEYPRVRNIDPSCEELTGFKKSFWRPSMILSPYFGEEEVWG